MIAGLLVDFVAALVILWLVIEASRPAPVGAHTRGHGHRSVRRTLGHRVECVLPGAHRPEHASGAAGQLAAVTA